MKKIMIFVFVFAVFTVNAQNYHLYVEQTNGTLDDYPLTSVRKLAFTENNEMTLYEVDGTIHIWDINTIQKYYYQEIATDINNVYVSFESNVYPNPAKESFNIDYIISESSKIDISIYSLDGKEIKRLVSENKDAGSYKLHMVNNFLTQGTYIITISSAKNKTSKKIIIL